MKVLMCVFVPPAVLKKDIIRDTGARMKIALIAGRG